MNLRSICKNLAVLVILFILACAGVGMIYGKMVDIMQTEDPISGGKGSTVVIDWEKEYPFDTSSEKTESSVSETEVSESSETKHEGGGLDQYVALFGRVKAAVEDSRQFIPFYTRFLELSGRVDKILGRTDFSGRDGVVVLKNGHLSCAEAKKETRVVEETANSIDSFSDWLDEEKIPFLYVQTPVKSDQYNNQFPEDVKDFSNENIDLLLANLEEKEISYLDLRDNIYQQGLDLYDMFYMTDHHWKVESGMWAAGEIADRLNEEFMFDMDTSVTDIENYTEKIYEDWFLGSWGAKVTLGYAEPEDFSIYIPDFVTNMRVVNRDKGVDLTGSFEEVVFDYEILNKCDYYDNNSYSSILYGNRPLTQITNYNCKDGKRILFIRDSFSLAMAPYFSLICQQTDLLDVRTVNGNFNGSVKTYIEEMQPDAVILMYNPENYEFK